ncbi:hypothetical protein [Actimicrobium antarcticum]|uniref:Lipoprotein SmpA/OmlA domain-containing protein n=1 Tax=Actimicrobium antarcticum TaxID=1051899 RepID=A0ABP7T176_9BURK
MLSFRPAILAFTLLTSGCAALLAPPVHPGDTEATVISQLGIPTHRYRDGNDQLLEYAKGPWGQRTWMARITPDGHLASYRQVLTSAVFATIIPGKSTKDTVLRTIGAPGETMSLPRIRQEVWSYAYKESDVWDSMMHVHFDEQGIVSQMLNGPDLRFDPDSRFPGR